MHNQLEKALVWTLVLLLLAPVQAAMASPEHTDPGLRPQLELTELHEEQLPQRVAGEVATDYVRPSLRAPETLQVFVQLEREPLGVVFAHSRRNGAELSAAAQQGVLNLLAAEQAEVQAAMNLLGVETLASFSKAFNGLSVAATAQQLEQLIQIPGIKNVYPAGEYKTQLSNSVPWIGATALHDLDLDGEGVRIAIIDTGIDYTHAALGGPGTTEAYQRATADLTIPDPDLFPSDKVIGGYDFIGPNWGRTADPLEPNPDPIDLDGHGTAVAANAAGLAVPGRLGAGVAPGAHLYALKVCSDFSGLCSGTAIVQAIEWSLDPNGDGDLSDHVDIINMSLGSRYGHHGLASAIATEVAAEVGVFVAAAAGNSSNRPYIASAPASATGATSVAASSPPGVSRPLLRVNSPEEIAADYVAALFAFSPQLIETGGVTADVAYVGRGCADPFDAYLDDPADKIALILRGACRFDEKARRAEEAGAVAVVIQNDTPGEAPFAGGGDPIITIPALMIAYEDGLTIRTALIDGPVNASLSPDIVLSLPELTDVVAGFSSRGPRTSDSALKPDITAPGTDVFTAAAGTGNRGTVFGGTSFATPFIAGAAALLRQAHPDWSAQQVRAALMNTANPATYLDDNPGLGGQTGTRTPVSRQGAGRVQVDQAAATDTVVQLLDGQSGVSFGYTPVANEWTANKTLEVHNFSGQNRTYDLSWSWRDDSRADQGVVLTLSQSSVSVPAGGVGTVDVTLSVNATDLSTWNMRGSAVVDGDRFSALEYDGFIYIHETGSETTHTAPFHFLPRKASAAAWPANSLMLDSYAPDVYPATVANAANHDDGFVDIFALLEENPQRAFPPDFAFNRNDIKHVGVRAVGSQYGPLLQFAISYHDPFAHPLYTYNEVYLDVNQDGEYDYVLLNDDLGLLLGSDIDGSNVTALCNLHIASCNFQFYTGDLNTDTLILTVIAEDMEVDLTDMAFDFYVYSFDGYFWAFRDVAPYHFPNSGRAFRFDALHPAYDADTIQFTVDGNKEINLFAWQAGQFRSPSQKGLLMVQLDGAEGMLTQPLFLSVSAGASIANLHGQTNVPIDASLVVDFTTAVDTSTIDFTSDPARNLAVSWEQWEGIGPASGGFNRAIITPAAEAGGAWGPGTEYTIRFADALAENGFLIAGNSFSFSTAGRLQPRDFTFTSEAEGAGDTWIYAGRPNDNRGQAQTMWAGHGDLARALVQFDVSDLPPGTEVHNATLHVRYLDHRGVGGTGAVKAHEVTTRWQEMEATWNEPWSAPGGVPHDVNPTPADSVWLDTATTGTTLTFDVTEVVSNAVAAPDRLPAQTLASLMLRFESDRGFTTRISLATSAYFDPSARPLLIVNASVPESLGEP